MFAGHAGKTENKVSSGGERAVAAAAESVSLGAHGDASCGAGGRGGHRPALRHPVPCSVLPRVPPGPREELDVAFGQHCPGRSSPRERLRPPACHARRPRGLEELSSHRPILGRGMGACGCTLPPSVPRVDNSETFLFSPRSALWGWTSFMSHFRVYHMDCMDFPPSLLTPRPLLLCLDASLSVETCRRFVTGRVRRKPSLTPSGAPSAPGAAEGPAQLDRHNGPVS